ECPAADAPAAPPAVSNPCGHGWVLLAVLVSFVLGFSGGGAVRLVLGLATRRQTVTTGPDGGDVHDEDYSGRSADIAAIRLCPDRNRPPGIAAAASYRFRRAPIAAEVAAYLAAGETYAAAALAAEAAAAGLAFAARAAGCLVPLAAASAPPGAGAAAGVAPGPPPAAAAALAPLAAGAMGPAAAGVPGGAPAGPPVAASGARRSRSLAVGAAAAAAAAAQWVAVESAAFARRGDAVALPANAVAHGDLAIAPSPGGPNVVLRSAQAMDPTVYAALESVRDPRVLDGPPFDVTRPRRGWSDICKDLTETAYPTWTAPGPRTAKWCAEWLDRRSTTPAAHHRQFLSVFGLRPGAWGVEIYGAALRVLEEAACFDGVNICDLAGIESLMRKTELTEYVYWMDSMGATEKAEEDKEPSASTVTFVGLMDEAAIFSGLNKDTGSAMVCPALLDHVSREVEKDATILKQVRKAK
ncbi:unnamed protein product, partial [Prorocentrum cordatum]